VPPVHELYTTQVNVPLLKGQLGKLYTVKKDERFSCPQTGGPEPNSPWPGIIKLFLARESLVSDIPAGDGNSLTFFYSVSVFLGIQAYKL
jgi:hypothetical protein